MTEEQAEKIIQALKDFQTADIVAAICAGIFVIAILLDVIYFIYKYKKVKEMLEKYYLTLNEEQKDAIKKYREIKKLWSQH